MGLDLGTSAIKGILMDLSGHIIAEAGKATRFTHPREGWTEIEPEGHHQDACGVIRELAAAAPGPVAALSMAAASGNTLLTTEDGRPLTNILSWLDNREAQKESATLKAFSADEVRRVTGWLCVTIFPLAHLAWLKENRAEAYRTCGKFCMNTDWLLYRLTGNWVMDHSTATTFHLQDQTGKCWHTPFLERLGIRPEKLSRLVESGSLAGTVTATAARDTGLSVATKIITGCFDHPASARAVGVLDPGQLLLSTGTSWVGFFPASDRRQIIERDLLCDPYRAFQGGPWGAIFSIPYIGRAIDAYVDQMIAPGESDRYRIFDECAAEAQPGANGLKIDLREAVQPIQATRANISRAVMEGAAELFNERLLELKGHGMTFQKAVMTGGPAGSSVWPGVVADITGLEISVRSRHAGARGAALLAGIGAGFYRDDADAFQKAGERYGC